MRSPIALLCPRSCCSRSFMVLSFHASIAFCRQPASFSDPSVTSVAISSLRTATTIEQPVSAVSNVVTISVQERSCVTIAPWFASTRLWICERNALIVVASAHKADMVTCACLYFSLRPSRRCADLRQAEVMPRILAVSDSGSIIAWKQSQVLEISAVFAWNKVISTQSFSRTSRLDVVWW